jgi:hypothetical protein
MIGIDEVSAGRAAAILAFPASGRRARPAPRADEPRGEILLFTGVRYERLPEPEFDALWTADADLGAADLAAASPGRGLGCDQHRAS